MNREIIRQRFKDYRQEIRELQAALEDSYYYQDEAVSRCERRTEACRREQADRERQEEADRWYREGELKSATRDLERARSYGDAWGEERALTKLKKLY